MNDNLKNITLNHQFLNSDFYFPNWDIDTLILGTFNPNCGENVDYFYGRCRNKFWRAIENILDLEYCSLQNNFNKKLNVMKELKFGCVDIIKLVKFESSSRSRICGQGYSDSFLFTKKYIDIQYQFEEITNFIIKRKVSCVLNTWGKRAKPKDFKEHLNRLNQKCRENKIKYIEQCPSPSGRSRTSLEELSKFYKKVLVK